MIYSYAVMDENQPSDIRCRPYSVHRSREAAIRQASKLNREDPNNHYRAVQWAGDADAREFYACCLDA